MDAHKVLYFTDGRDVTVTDADFQVKNVIYPLDGIFSHRVYVVLPHRTPFTVLTALGVVVFLCGAFDFLPSSLSESTSLFGIPVVVNGLIMALGIAVTLLGMFATFHLKDKYVVKLSTSAGEKTALVSHKQDYVNRITDALTHAHIDQMKKPAAKTRR